MIPIDMKSPLIQCNILSALPWQPGVPIFLLRINHFIIGDLFIFICGV